MTEEQQAPEPNPEPEQEGAESLEDDGTPGAGETAATETDDEELEDES